MKAFLPGSQVDLRPVRNLDALLGQNFEFKVIKFNKKRGNIVLSRRVLLEKERAEMKKHDARDARRRARSSTGIVKNITDYGAFIDLGGIDGLLHITDMSLGPRRPPVASCSRSTTRCASWCSSSTPTTERVSLGLKQIRKIRGASADETYPAGTRVRGKVVSLTDYGAFVELEQGVEGLIHVCEMSWTKRVKHPSKILDVGDTVEAVVLDVDADGRSASRSA